jgi:NADPH2:quinone reductase
MRAWQVRRQGSPLEVLESVDLEVPVPEPGEMRIRVRCAAIGMPDVFMCSGVYPLTPPLPFVPGQEICGVIDAIGDGVGDAFAIGTRVMAVTKFYDGRGGFAEYTIAPPATVYAVPDSMSDVDAAVFRIGYSTAWIGLVRRGRLQAGETLLVLGAAGGSGSTAVQLGHALGARVLAVASGAEKLEFCSRMGADVVIDRSAGSVVDAVREATNGRGVDVIYDPVGGEAAEDASTVLAADGRLLLVGFASGRWPVIDAHDTVLGNFSLVGVFAGGYTKAENEDDQAALVALYAEGKLPSFAHAEPFDDLPRAMQAVADGTVIGKTVVTF